MLVCFHIVWCLVLVGCEEVHMGRSLVLHKLFLGLEVASVMLGIRSV